MSGMAKMHITCTTASTSPPATILPAIMPRRTIQVTTHPRIEELVIVAPEVPGLAPPAIAPRPIARRDTLPEGILAAGGVVVPILLAGIQPATTLDITIPRSKITNAPAVIAFRPSCVRCTGQETT
jgi:hypothetical protein